VDGPVERIEARSEGDRPGASSPKPLVSIVATAYNEEANLQELYLRVRAVLEATGNPFELMVVDNGSADHSLELLRKLREGDPRVSYVSLSRNFGHQGGLIAALDFSRGDIVITMDADLQHPPETIPSLLVRWEEGNDVVHATERPRRRAGPLRGRLGGVFYWLFDRLSGLDLRSARSDFRLMDRRVVDALCGLPERQKFIRGLVRWLGFRQTSVYYDLAERLHGESKFRYRELFALAADAMLSFSVIPLRLLALSGLLLAIPSLAYALYVGVLGVLALVSGNHGLIPPGWTTIVAALMFFGGVQLVGLGLLGEYLGRVYGEAKGRPPYIVQEVAVGTSDGEERPRPASAPYERARS
jgi:glycosyltransferase involved in cell wall biosynthesis